MVGVSSSQFWHLAFDWPKSTANWAWASNADMLGLVLNYLNYVDKGGLWKMYVYEQNAYPDSKLSSYVLFMGPSFPLFSCCVLENMHKICLFVAHTLLSFGHTSQCNVLNRFHDFHITLSLNNVERTSLEISFQTGNKKALFIVTKHQKTELSKLGWALFCCSHCGFFKCNHRFALYKFINISGKL